ncbi:TPA: hypothetical protein ACQTX0_006566 [Pseudomonas aeruginosa]
MSEVKRFDHVNHAHIDDCEHVESSEGAWVTASDYDALAAEAQALREQNAKFQHMEQERDRIERNRDMWKGLCERQAEQLEALRARVVVTPERLKSADSISRMLREIGYDGDVNYHHACEIWNACLDALARLNGLTVSESALDTLRRFATGNVKHLNNGLCPDAFEGHEARDPDCPVCRALLDTES